jgi:tetratricopeptide (TPR) repeat protein
MHHFSPRRESLKKTSHLFADRFFPACVQLVLMCLVLIGLCACTPTPESYYKKMAKLTVLENSDEELKEKIGKLPPEELTEKGYFYLAKDNLQLARLHFAVALQKQPETVAAKAGLGQVFFYQGDMGRARELFDAVVARDPENVVALLGLGRIARERGQYQDALDLFGAAYEKHPDDPVLATELAMTHDTIGQQNLPLAEPLYRKVVTLQPDTPGSYNNLGFNFLLQGRYAEAIPLFQQALVIDEQDSRARNNLATAYLLNNDETKALQLFESTLGKPAAYNNIGYLYMTQGNWDKAEKAFRKALELNPVFYMRAQQNLERLNRLRSQGSD